MTVKLLPFDNKSELQVVLDLPQGASLEATERTLAQVRPSPRACPRSVSVGGLRRDRLAVQFQRPRAALLPAQPPELGDLQIELSPKDERAPRQPRDRARSAPAARQADAACTASTLQVVEAPPGPPVLATLLAEIYGPDAATRRAVADQVKALFKSIPYIVDVDDSHGSPRPQLRLTPVRDQLEYFGVSDRDVFNSIAAVMGGETVGYSHRGEGRTPMEISIRLPQSDRTWSDRLATTPVAVTRIAGAPTPGDARRGGAGDPRRPARRILSPRRPRRRDGHRRAGGPVRGADLRHARRR